MTPHKWKISSRTILKQLNQTLQYSRQYFKEKKTLQEYELRVSHHIKSFLYVE